MQRLAALSATLALLAGVSAGAASAKLTPAEQTWVSPVLTIYNLEATAIDHVQSEELVVVEDGAAAGKKFNTLRDTLAVFAACPKSIREAGTPPTTRLEAFDHDMVASCAHLYSGSEDVAKAIGYIRAGEGKPAETELVASQPLLKTGANDLNAAGRVLLSIGGRAAFEA